MTTLTIQPVISGKVDLKDPHWLVIKQDGKPAIEILFTTWVAAAHAAGALYFGEGVEYAKKNT